VRPADALLRTTLPTKLFVQHVSANARCKPDHRVSQPLVLETTRGRPRRSLTQLTLPEQLALAGLILEWINDSRVRRHSHLTHNRTESFLIAHREWISEVEDFLVSRGAGRFVPLPTWNPADPIPVPFRLVKPRDDGTARQALGNADPRRPLPLFLTSPAVCAIPTGGALAEALDPWHDDVHVDGIGGAMAPIGESAACAVFYPWHAFVDEVYWTWQQCG
jgi:hypothetical protein